MRKILVIDDDSLVRETIVQILRRNGYEVVTAEDGRLGIKAFQSERPDLVITDIVMPEQDGIETILEIRRTQPSTQIIAISGGGRIHKNNFLKVAEKLGASSIIAKPFEPEELLNRVERCFAAA